MPSPRASFFQLIPTRVNPPPAALSGAGVAGPAGACGRSRRADRDSTTDQRPRGSPELGRVPKRAVKRHAACVGKPLPNLLLAALRGRGCVTLDLVRVGLELLLLQFLRALHRPLNLRP